jgi:hypothetical protein
MASLKKTHCIRNIKINNEFILGRKCWSVVNFILSVRLLARVVYHIPQVKSANLSLKMQVRVRSKRKTKVTDFHGKRNFAKITRSTIWEVQLKSEDN